MAKSMPRLNKTHPRANGAQQFPWEKACKTSPHLDSIDQALGLSSEELHSLSAANCARDCLWFGVHDGRCFGVYVQFKARGTLLLGNGSLGEGAD